MVTRNVADVRVRYLFGFCLVTIVSFLHREVNIMHEVGSRGDDEKPLLRKQGTKMKTDDNKKARRKEKTKTRIRTNIRTKKKQTEEDTIKRKQQKEKGLKHQQKKEDKKNMHVKRPINIQTAENEQQEPFIIIPLTKKYSWPPPLIILALNTALCSETTCLSSHCLVRFTPFAFLLPPGGGPRGNIRTLISCLPIDLG